MHVLQEEIRYVQITKMEYSVSEAAAFGVAVGEMREWQLSQCQLMECQRSQWRRRPLAVVSIGVAIGIGIGIGSNWLCRSSQQQQQPKEKPLGPASGTLERLRLSELRRCYCRSHTTTGVTWT